MTVRELKQPYRLKWKAYREWRQHRRELPFLFDYVTDVYVTSEPEWNDDLMTHVVSVRARYEPIGVNRVPLRFLTPEVRNDRA